MLRHGRASVNGPPRPLGPEGTSARPVTARGRLTPGARAPSLVGRGPSRQRGAPPMEDKSYDLIVIGSGPAGEKGAAQAAYFGKSVAVIEREPALGGAAANTGTLPSK